jgi:hypothetical protein
MAKGNRDKTGKQDNDNRKNAGHGDTMRRESPSQRQHNDSAGRGSQDNSRREQGSSSSGRR